MFVSRALRISSFLVAVLVSVPVGAMAQEAAPAAAPVVAEATQPAFNPQCVLDGKKVDITLLEGSHIGGGGEPKKLKFSIPEAYVYRSATGPEVTSFSARLDWSSMIPYCFHYMPAAPKSVVADMALSQGELLLRYSLILLQEPFTDPTKYRDYLYKNEVDRHPKAALKKNKFGYSVFSMKAPEIVVDENGVETKLNHTIHLVPGGIFGPRPSFFSCKLPMDQKEPETCHVQFFRDNLIIATDFKWEWLGEDPKVFYDAVMQFTEDNIVKDAAAIPAAAPASAEGSAPTEESVPAE